MKKILLLILFTTQLLTAYAQFVVSDPTSFAQRLSLFAEELYKFIYKYNHEGQLPELVLVTQKFARFVSKAFCFSEYSDEDVFKFIDKYNDAMRK